MDEEMLLPVCDFAASPELKRIGWTSKRMIQLIRAEILPGRFDSNYKRYVTTEKAIRLALKFRNEAIKIRLVDLENVEISSLDLSACGDKFTLR